MIINIPIEMETLTKWAGAIAAFFTLLGWLARLAFKWMTADPIKEIQTAGEISLYAKLQNEIERSAKTIKELEERIEELEDKIHELQNIEMEGAPDMGILQTLLNQFPCGQNCGNPTEVFDQTRDVISRIIARRAKRFQIMKEV